IQLPVIGSTFLTLSQPEESTVDNRKVSHRTSALIIRALIISAAPKVPSSGTHQCPAVRPISATQQCHPSVMTSSAIHQCQAVLTQCAH
ncbi:unnamed protein product, partial [Staurois parvus]